MNSDPAKHLEDPAAQDETAQIMATRGNGKPVDPDTTAPVITGTPAPDSVTAGTAQTDTVAASENASDQAIARKVADDADRGE